MDFQGQSQATKGRKLVVSSSQVQAVRGVISEADVQYVDAYSLLAATEWDGE